ncbi:MAG: hypothetical protein HYX92_04360 [Chloroflexi bacterium]|nr:hypothetical protein [Chloroflexota bacterium]
MRRVLPIILLIPLVLVVAAGCNSGMPAQAGQYEILPRSLSYDGREYAFLWTDKDGRVHNAGGDDIKLVEDSRTYLEIKDGPPVLHLAKDQSINVQAEDRHGSFTTFWYPFMLGRMLSPGGSPVIITQPAPGAPSTPPQTPTYHYPPANSFGRDDTLQGSVTNNKPAAPDYGRIQPAPHSVSGKSAGTGGGTAATGKAGSSQGGQQGGTGIGSAASGKGGFKGSGGAPTVGGGSGRPGSSIAPGGRAAPSIGGGSGRTSSPTAPRGGGFGGGKVGSVGRSGARGGGK